MEYEVETRERHRELEQSEMESSNRLRMQGSAHAHMQSSMRYLNGPISSGYSQLGPRAALAETKTANGGGGSLHEADSMHIHFHRSEHVFQGQKVTHAPSVDTGSDLGSGTRQ